MENQPSGAIKILAAIAFLIMVVVNGLANALPLNGVTTGQVSDSYPNLFAPTALTFAIWGVIYLLLAIYTLYQLGLFMGDKREIKAELLNKIGILFIISSLSNAAWVFSWHFDMIPLSMLFMVIILISLIYTMKLIVQEKLSLKEKLLIKLPFSVYFGWITVATIANATVLLVSLNWNGFGLSEPLWTVIILIVGMLIGAATAIRNRDAAYGLVLVWAYLGIYIKHTAPGGFAGQYPSVITTIMVCLILLLAAAVYSWIAGRRETA